MRILVVEDEAHIRKLLLMILRKEESYTVEEAVDGQDALEFLQERGFDWDVVITDIQMPRMSGIELLKEVSKEAPAITCIVLTAFRNDSLVLGALGNGVFDYILKPVQVKQFQQAVRRAIERRKRFAGSDDTIELSTGLQGWVELTVPSDYEYVERFRTFTSLLGRTSLDPQIKEDIRIVIDELGQNAVEWGNREDRNKQIRLSYCMFDDRIVFKIEDEGEGFHPESLNDPSIDPLNHIMTRMQQGKRAGGYGVFISKKLMDDVLYNDQGNVVLLTKFFRSPSPEGEEAAEPS